MIEEPKAVKEIHDIRIAIYEEMKGLTLHEKFMKVKERANVEWERMMGQKEAPSIAADEKEEYGREE